SRGLGDVYKRQVYQDQLFDGMKVMLLFASPQDVVEVVEAGVDLKSVNIGGMRFGEGKKMITNFISVDSKDVESFLVLMNAGIELEIRQVPT
ncbi:PTS sugar transporter subunit IIB, partial [Enterococcus sp. S181_ASV_20]|nr:PTS sugar transporter subunit IIB [Enterococcus sp. S181_ASV_20]